MIVLHAPILVGAVIGPRAEDKWTREQEAFSQMLSSELAARSKVGKLIIVRRSSHFIQIDRPDVVIAAIRRVVQTVRMEARNR
jgi:pimeloyl-ACP methyl ester carboxylesterase